MMTITKELTDMIPYSDINGALKMLQGGGIILFPTDTIWSIGCDATNEHAVRKLDKILAGGSEPSFELLVDSIDMLKQYVDHLHPRIETLLVYHVRPLTVILEGARKLPQGVTQTDGSIAVRRVQDEYSQTLIGVFGKPILSAYAHYQNDPLPTNFGAISSEILQSVDFVSKYRQNEKKSGFPSVMVRLSEENDELIFLRD